MGGEAEFRALNQSTIIVGHLLYRRAQNSRIAFSDGSVEATQSASASCSWLGTEGFWHDGSAALGGLQ